MFFTQAAFGQQVTLEWDPVPVADLAGYNLYRKLAENPDGSWLKVNQELIQENRFTDTTIEFATEYFYVATAVNTSQLESDFSNQVDHTEWNTVKPPDPDNLRVRPDDLAYSIYWDRNPDVENYRILAGKTIDGQIQWKYLQSTTQRGARIRLPGSDYDHVGVQAVTLDGTSGITKQSITRE